MKRFIKYLAVIALIAVLMMALLDLAYTTILKTTAPRTKFQIMRSLQGQELDYIFLGSSRVANGLVPEIIEEITGKKTINLGFQGAKMEDIFTTLKLLDRYNIRSKKVFIQIDYIFDIDGRSIQLPFEMVPFIHDNDQTRDYFKGERDFLGLYYVPFYRYCVFDQKVGFREVGLALAARNFDGLKTQGYAPLPNENHLDAAYSLPEAIALRNKTYEAICEYARRNKIEVVFYCAPFWKNTQNLDYIAKLKTKIPGLLDYSGAIDQPTMFTNPSHLNDNGARRFTEILARDIKKTVKD